MRKVVFRDGDAVRVFTPAFTTDSDAALLELASPAIPPGAARHCFAPSDLPACPPDLWAWDGTASPPTIAAPAALAAAQAARIAAVKAAYAAQIAAGMAWEGHILQIDDASTARLTAAVGMAAFGLPPGFAWRMADNSPLALDTAGLGAMAQAAGARVYALRAVMWAKLDAIRAAADLAGVEAIDPAAGWPA